jgi:Zn-dependent protease with chaperone function
MTASLAVLCLAAFAISALVCSAVLAALLPALDGALGRLAPARRPVAWLLIAALPALASTLLIAAALLPSAGVGFDHCLAHDAHHPHLCLHHPQATPAAALLAIAGLMVARLGFTLARTARNALRVRATRRALDAATVDRVDGVHIDVHIIEHPTPHAFALGGARPCVYVSASLLALGPAIADPVLAHERAHLVRRHLMLRTLAGVLCAFHLPGVARAIARRLSHAQEMAADADAARQLGDGVRVAEALVTLARLRATPARHALALSFAGGDIAARVHALIEPRAPRSAPALALASLAALALGALCAFPETVHHALETVLGALS